ncbi:MAG: DoxX family protein [Alphaproteobacteria bacterium]|jgi:putative oxidoreductase|nr:MAG: DoxX family protein [Alphaproteobacteria bacterium]
MDETGESSVLLVARFLLGSLFLWSGIGQVQGYDETAIFLARHGVIGSLLPVAIFVELAGAVLIITGYRTKWTCLTLAGFCVMTALLFHANFADRTQMFHFLKNVAIAGGLLALYVTGPGRLSFDGMGQPEDQRTASRS